MESYWIVSSNYYKRKEMEKIEKKNDKPLHNKYLILSLINFP